MTQPVKCTNCGALFGIVQPDGTIAIKYRDLFRVISGSVHGPCRKCGSDVAWPDAPYTIPAVRWTWAQPSPIFTCSCACTICMSGSCCQNYTRTIRVDHTNDVI